jgi:hypothetical protein
LTKGKHTAAIPSSNGDLDIEPPESGDQGRILILKTAPRSRKVQLIAQGTKEIRCIGCEQIRPLASATESEEGWICDDCAPETMQELYHIGKRAGATDV